MKPTRTFRGRGRARQIRHNNCGGEAGLEGLNTPRPHNTSRHASTIETSSDWTLQAESRGKKVPGIGGPQEAKCFKQDRRKKLTSPTPCDATVETCVSAAVVTASPPSDTALSSDGMVVEWLSAQGKEETSSFPNRERRKSGCNSIKFNAGASRIFAHSVNMVKSRRNSEVGKEGNNEDAKENSGSPPNMNSHANGKYDKNITQVLGESVAFTEMNEKMNQTKISGNSLTDKDPLNNEQKLVQHNLAVPSNTKTALHTDNSSDTLIFRRSREETKFNIMQATRNRDVQRERKNAKYYLTKCSLSAKAYDQVRANRKKSQKKKKRKDEKEMFDERRPFCQNSAQSAAPQNYGANHTACSAKYVTSTKFGTTEKYGTSEKYGLNTIPDSSSTKTAEKHRSASSKHESAVGEKQGTNLAKQMNTAGEKNSDTLKYRNGNLAKKSSCKPANAAYKHVDTAVRVAYTATQDTDSSRRSFTTHTKIAGSSVKSGDYVNSSEFAGSTSVIKAAGIVDSCLAGQSPYSWLEKQFSESEWDLEPIHDPSPHPHGWALEPECKVANSNRSLCQQNKTNSSSSKMEASKDSTDIDVVLRPTEMASLDTDRHQKDILGAKDRENHMPIENFQNMTLEPSNLSGGSQEMEKDTSVQAKFGKEKKGKRDIYTWTLDTKSRISQERQTHVKTGHSNSRNGDQLAEGRSFHPQSGNHGKKEKMADEARCTTVHQQASCPKTRPTLIYKSSQECEHDEKIETDTDSILSGFNSSNSVTGETEKMKRKYGPSKKRKIINKKEIELSENTTFASQDPLKTSHLLHNEVKNDPEKREPLTQNTTKYVPGTKGSLTHETAKNILDTKEPVTHNAAKYVSETKKSLIHETMKTVLEKREPLSHKTVKNVPERREPLTHKTVKNVPERREPLTQKAVKNVPERREPLTYKTVKNVSERREPLSKKAVKNVPERREPLTHKTVKNVPERREPLTHKTMKNVLQTKELLTHDTVMYIPERNESMKNVPETKERCIHNTSKYVPERKESQTNDVVRNVPVRRKHDTLHPPSGADMLAECGECDVEIGEEVVAEILHAQNLYDHADWMRQQEYMARWMNYWIYENYRRMWATKMQDGRIPGGRLPDAGYQEARDLQEDDKRRTQMAQSQIGQEELAARCHADQGHVERNVSETGMRSPPPPPPHPWIGGAQRGPHRPQAYMPPYSPHGMMPLPRPPMPPGDSYRNYPPLPPDWTHSMGYPSWNKWPHSPTSPKSKVEDMRSVVSHHHSPSPTHWGQVSPNSNASNKMDQQGEPFYPVPPSYPMEDMQSVGSPHHSVSRTHSQDSVSPTNVRAVSPVADANNMYQRNVSSPISPGYQIENKQSVVSTHPHNSVSPTHVRAVSPSSYARGNTRSVVSTHPHNSVSPTHVRAVSPSSYARGNTRSVVSTHPHNSVSPTHVRAVSPSSYARGNTRSVVSTHPHNSVSPTHVRAVSPSSYARGNTRSVVSTHPHNSVSPTHVRAVSPSSCAMDDRRSVVSTHPHNSVSPTHVTAVSPVSGTNSLYHHAVGGVDNRSRKNSDVSVRKLGTKSPSSNTNYSQMKKMKIGESEADWDTCQSMHRQQRQRKKTLVIEDKRRVESKRCLMEGFQNAAHDTSGIDTLGIKQIGLKHDKSRTPKSAQVVLDKRPLSGGATCSTNLPGSYSSPNVKNKQDHENSKKKGRDVGVRSKQKNSLIMLDGGNGSCGNVSEDMQVFNQHRHAKTHLESEKKENMNIEQAKVSNEDHRDSYNKWRPIRKRRESLVDYDPSSDSEEESIPEKKALPGQGDWMVEMKQKNEISGSDMERVDKEMLESVEDRRLVDGHMSKSSRNKQLGDRQIMESNRDRELGDRQIMESNKDRKLGDRQIMESNRDRELGDRQIMESNRELHRNSQPGDSRHMEECDTDSSIEEGEIPDSWEDHDYDADSRMVQSVPSGEESTNAGRFRMQDSAPGWTIFSQYGKKNSDSQSSSSSGSMKASPARIPALMGTRPQYGGAYDVPRSGSHLPPRLQQQCGNLQVPRGKLDQVTWTNWRQRHKNAWQTASTPFIDTHCHLDFLFQRSSFKGSFQKYRSANMNTFPSNFEGCVAIFCNPQTFNKSGGLWQDLLMENAVWGAVGCHPKSATDYTSFTEASMKYMLKHPKMVALGEIGLDYSNMFHEHAEVQKRVFRSQLRLAVEMSKPLVIHCRDAEEDCREILEEMVPNNYRIHRHCFTGTWAECETWMQTFPNSYIGLTPLVTWQNQRSYAVREVARYIPLNRLLLETDAPYFVPKQIPRSEMEFSHPGLAITVAQEVASLQGRNIEEVLQNCRENTRQMYGI